MSVRHQHDKGTCHDVILQVKCFQWRREMLMLFYKPEKQGSLAHTEVCTSVTRHLPFSELPFRTSLGMSPLCQEVKVYSATSSQPGKLNLLKGHGIRPIEKYRKEEISDRVASYLNLENCHEKQQTTNKAKLPFCFCQNVGRSLTRF